MILAHRVSLGGVQLDEIDPRIIIKGIDGGAGKEAVTAAGTGAGDGTRITGKHRDSMEIQVRFSMNISARRGDIDRRAKVLEAINAWAAAAENGGAWLQVNYKENRRLWVDEVVTPGEGDLWKRLSEYTIVFRAHAIPYWMENSAVSAATKTGQSGSGTITVAGSAKTVADAELANKSGATINTATVTIGGNEMSFEQLALAANEALVFSHSTASGKNVIRIRIRNAQGSYRSVLNKRTAGSADEFEILPGDCAFSFSAQRACTLTVSVRGRFR